MGASKKHIVLVSYYFPGINHVASRRSYAFYKYLDSDKYDVTVVTAAQSDKENVVFVDPNSGLRRRKTTTKYFVLNKINAAYNKVFMRLILDENKGWTKALKKSLFKLNKEKPIDVLLSSFAPVSTLIAGLDFKSNNKDAKWILDMRDELSSSPFISEGRRGELIVLEKECLKHANALISVSKPIVDEFVKLSNNVNDNLIFSEIRNGFDFSLNDIGLKTRNKKFTLSYMGSFYGSRKPTNLFKAMVELIKEGRLSKENLHLNIWSSAKSYIIPSFLDGCVQSHASVTEEQSIINMRNSDVLLLIHPANGAKGVFTGKLFEYLGSLRPVLALVDKEDVAAKMILDLKAGWVAENESIEQIKEAVLSAYSFWLNEDKYEPNMDGIKSLHRRFQVQKFEKEILEEMYVR